VAVVFGARLFEPWVVGLRGGGMRRWNLPNASAILLGTAFWLTVCWMLCASAYRVYARATRDTIPVHLSAPPGHGLSVGDGVFSSTQTGLKRIGEVSGVADNGAGVALSINPHAFNDLNTSIVAVCWRTPMNAEQALTALLPPAIQRRVTDQIADAWREGEEELLAAWKPIVADLTGAYLNLIADDVEQAVSRRKDELTAVTRSHRDALAAEWPAIQARLSPIMKEHLTPVLSRLMSDALDDAPKARIAWSIARGKNTQAFRQVLDWLAEYLAQMSDQDKAEMSEAVENSWEAARDDDQLVGHFKKLGRNIRDDRRLRALLTEIYREAISENPQTAEYLRAHILESSRVHEQAYAFIEWFAPTARRAVAICLFDESGVTRPEVVHLVRSTALGRQVAWVTLDTPGVDAPPLEPGATVAAKSRGSTP